MFLITQWLIDPFLHSVFVQEIEFMSENIWNKAAANNAAVDFHDVMFKFTLDSFILYVPSTSMAGARLLISE